MIYIRASLARRASPQPRIPGKILAGSEQFLCERTSLYDVAGSELDHSYFPQRGQLARERASISRYACRRLSCVLGVERDRQH